MKVGLIRNHGISKRSVEVIYAMSQVNVIIFPMICPDLSV